ncbi:MAG: DUF1761 domain-containing protein [Saprospiraceae bacterium]|nr:DUF1761 domain-containing protein [Saprospiraceae bacterium]
MLIVAASGIIPMLVGFIWYNPSVMGTIWMGESGFNPETAKKTSMVKVLGIGLLFSIMLAISLMPAVIHQMGLTSMLADDPSLKDPNSELSKTLAMLLDKYGRNYRTFKHGALHGFVTTLFLVLPVIGTNALYEQKSAKYVAVHVGYWAICLTLMGGVICAFA